MKKYAVLATLMLLVIGLGSFQYWAIGQQETATAGIGTVVDGLTVKTQNPIIVSSPRPWRPFSVGNATYYLYNITRASGYNGNYTATLYLTNADELGKDFIYLIMNVTLNTSDGTVVDHKWLGLENGRVQFNIDKTNFSSSPAYINITGGVANIPWWKTGELEDPQFVIDVEETGY
ncbi:MAG: hypothetical protein ACXQTW_07500 [Candidatus Methanospirareceae archaeon]